MDVKLDTKMNYSNPEIFQSGLISLFQFLFV